MVKQLKKTTQEYQKAAADHLIQPFTDAAQLNEIGAKIITKAEGVWIWDSGGNKILDGMAGLWCVNIGYGRKELAEAAYEQIKELSYYNLFFQTAHPKAIELAELLDEVTPAHMNHVFFTASGSEANDTIVRSVRHYWATLAKPEKSVIISRKNAYHGSTMAGASLGGMKTMHEQGGLPIPGIEHISQPYWFKEGGDLSPEEFGIQAAQALEEKILEIGEDKVAAFIAEPIQGAGGVIVPPDSYWPEINRILKKYDILFIADEVITGFGRTGHWFASETYNLEPDLMTIAKGLSSGYACIGGVVFSKKVADVLIHSGGELAHGYTYSGHPVMAAIALENLKIMQRENIVERVRNDIAPYFQKRWLEFNDYEIIGETRSVGLLGALELTNDKIKRSQFAESLQVGKTCVGICTKHNLVMRAVGDSMIVCPSLCITIEEVDIMMEKIHAVLKDLSQQFIS